MSRGYWSKGVALKLIVSAVALIVGLLIILGGLSAQSKRKWESYQRNARYAADTYHPVYEACIQLPQLDQSECIADANNRYRENYRDESDLVAQQTMAAWTGLMGSAAVVGMMLSAFGVWLIAKTLVSTREMVEETRRIGEAQVRAYLTFKLGIWSFTDTGELTIESAVENVGNSPARHVEAVIRADIGYAVGADSGHLRAYGSQSFGQVAAQSTARILITHGDIKIPADASPASIHLTVGVFAIDVFGQIITTSYTCFITEGRVFSEEVGDGIDADYDEFLFRTFRPFHHASQHDATLSKRRADWLERRIKEQEEAK